MYEAVSDAIARGDLDAQFGVVFCNRDRGEDPATDAFFERVRADGVPLATRSSVAYRRAVGGQRSRAGEALAAGAHEHTRTGTAAARPAGRGESAREGDAALAPYAFDIGVLAGYMLIFGREFVQRHVLLNLHPALPGGPRGTWREVIRELIRTRASDSGVMLH